MEKWKRYKETLFEISNFGRIRNFNTKQIIQPSLFGGYYQINHVGFVHRLVGELFIKNPNNLPEINHKDENKINNNVDNLEWCSSKYNANYGTHPKKLSKALKNKPKLRKDGSNWLSERNKNNYRGCKSKEEYFKKHPDAKGAFFNHKHSEETRKKISDSLKKNWKNQYSKGGD